MEKAMCYTSEEILLVALINCPSEEKKLEALNNLKKEIDSEGYKIERLICSGYMFIPEFIKEYAPNYDYCYGCQSYHSLTDTTITDGICKEEEASNIAFSIGMEKKYREFMEESKEYSHR